jgi:competence protein ComEA
MKKLLWVLLAFFAFTSVAMAAVNLNTASKADLDSVKGIGPKKAEAIVEYRKKNGSFKTVDDLKNVPGFGEKSVATMRAELTVGGAASAKADKKADAKPEAVKADKKADVAKTDSKPAKAEAKKDEKPPKADMKAGKTDAKAGGKEVKTEKK